MSVLEDRAHDYEHHALSAVMVRFSLLVSGRTINQFGPGTPPFPAATSHLRYTGLLDANLTHSYSYNISLWHPDEESPVHVDNASLFVVTSMPHVVDLHDTIDAIDVTFVDATNLVKGDTWTFLLSSCGAKHPLPREASATLTSSDGTATVTQLTLDRGFEGSTSGSHDVYLINQHFTVRAAGTEVQSITVSNGGSTPSWTNGNPSYALSFNGSTPTACLAYDTPDWQLEVRVPWAHALFEWKPGCRMFKHYT